LKQGLFFENHFQRTTQIENVVTRYNLEKWAFQNEHLWAQKGDNAN
jgi:hypothetical protein